VKATAILTPAAIAVLLAGCATMSAARLADPGVRQTLDPIQLRPAVEANFVREDLVRATHTVTTTSYVNGMVMPATRQVPNDYSELVIDFGNGIVMDYNNNLCVDLLRFYGLDRLQGYHIERTPHGFTFESVNSYDLKNGVFTSTVGMYRKVVQDDKGAQIESGLLHSRRTIRVADRSVELTQNVLGVDVKKSAALTDDNTLEVHGFWRDATFRMETPDSAVMEGYFRIVHDGDHLIISYTGIFGIVTERTFFRTEKGLVFFDDQNRGVEILKDGNTIRIERDGRLAAEYSIESD
jgi:hypothetical protein